MQPVDWQDAGDALDHDELKGCWMPKGQAIEVNPPGAYLQYNEVRIDVYIPVFLSPPGVLTLFICI